MDMTRAMEILGEKFRFSFVDTNKVIQDLKIPENAKILDVGTGMGNLAITLALNGYTVITGEPIDDESIYANQNWLENAQKVEVDHLIDFQSFNAEDMPYEDNFFEAVFSLGTLHHIEETRRTNVFQELIRITRRNSVICFFEPNQRAVEMIRKSDASHPDAADPGNYIQGLNLKLRKIEGVNFDAFVLQKY